MQYRQDIEGMESSRHLPRLEAASRQFLAGSASARPHKNMVLPRSCIGLDLTASASSYLPLPLPCLASVKDIAALPRLCLDKTALSPSLGYYHAHVLLYVCVFNYNVNSNYTRYVARFGCRFFWRFGKFPPQICESCGATYRRKYETFIAL